MQAQINGQAWIDWLPATSQTQGVYPGEVGKTYVYRVQAMDAVGRLSDWVQSEPVSVQRVVTKYYFLGDQRVAMRQGDEVYYLHGDHLGSVSLVTDSNGEVVSRALYSPYGGLREGSTGPTDIGFTNQRREDFGLDDFNARMYSPFLGRFISPDTIVPGPGNPQNLNRYTYARNNPLGYVDPTGHWPGWFEFIAGAAYQFSNDMAVGIPNAAFGADWQTEQSDAFRGGQEVGRAFSTAAGLALTVDGAAKIAAGISLMPPTAGVGAVCTGGTGGLCAIPAGVAIGIEGAVVGVGAAEVGYGSAVVLMAAKNPVGGGGGASNNLSIQRQNRHIKGTKEWNKFGQKSYFNSLDDAQAVLDAYNRGEAKVLGTTNQGNIVVQYDEVTGFNNNYGAGYIDQPTNVFVIKPGKNNSSVVPTNPNWNPKGGP